MIEVWFIFWSVPGEPLACVARVDAGAALRLQQELEYRYGWPCWIEHPCWVRWMPKVGFE